MQLPQQLSLRETMHGHGAKGMAFYGYADNEGLGVRLEARREKHGLPFVETWFFDWLPGREFKSYQDLVEAVAPLTDADLAKVKDGYPSIHNAEPDACGNPCRLCPRPADRQPGDHYETWRVTLAYAWRDLHPLSLCDAHFEQYQRDPVGLKAAVEAEIALRRARRLERKG